MWKKAIPPMLLLFLVLAPIACSAASEASLNISNTGMIEYTSSSNPTWVPSDAQVWFSTDFSTTQKVISGGSFDLTGFPDMYSNVETAFAISFDTATYNSPSRSLEITWGDSMIVDGENPRPFITVYDVPDEYWAQEFIYIPNDFRLSDWQLLCEPYTGTWVDLTDSANAGKQRTLCVLFLDGVHGDGTANGLVTIRAELTQGVYNPSTDWESWTQLFKSQDLSLIKRGEWHEIRYHVKIAEAGMCEVWFKAESDESFTKICDYSGDIRSTTGGNDFVPIDHYKRVDEATTSIYIDDLSVWYR
ncbi:MAG: hypothetical protein PVH73_01885 [Candidatus Bathyarchaeota archaeon]|jgi:hypothetical protein